MNNEDLQRLYNIGVDRELPGDFVRRDKDGKIPGVGDGEKVTLHNFDNSADVYHYVNSIPLYKIKYITITGGDKTFTLMPQTSTIDYAAIRVYSNDGGYTLIVLKINPDTPIAFYINVYSGGGRDKYMITNISEYTVCVEE